MVDRWGDVGEYRWIGERRIESKFRVLNESEGGDLDMFKV